MSEHATPNYLDLIAAMAKGRPEYRHIVCLDPRLHAVVDEARRAKARADIAAQVAADNPAKRRRYGQVPDVDRCAAELDAAEKARDAASLAFIISPPTAAEERAIVANLTPAEEGKLYEYEVHTAQLLAGWQRTEQLDGTPVPEVGRDDYRRILEVATREQLAAAYNGLQRCAVSPDFR